MTVPYIFATMPASEGIPLQYLDDNFAAVSGGGAGGTTLTMEALTVTGLNTLSNLSETYSGGVFLLIVNGVTFAPVGAPAPFSVTGITVSWTSGTWSLNPGDTVVAIYSY